jgi:hypothetical protein
MKLRTASESVGWLQTEGPLTVSPQFGPSVPQVGGDILGRCVNCDRLSRLDGQDEVFACATLNIRIHATHIQDFGCTLYEPIQTGDYHDLLRAAHYHSARQEAALRVVNLRRMDTPENRAFWASVEQAAKDLEASKPAWCRELESPQADPAVDPHGVSNTGKLTTCD